jgi:hypothetical protein
VRRAYQTILHSAAEKSPAAHLEGVVVQPMAKPGGCNRWRNRGWRSSLACRRIPPLDRF